MRLVLLIAAVACLFLDAAASAEHKLNIAGTKDDSAPARQPDNRVNIIAGKEQGGKTIHWMAFTGDVAGVAQAIVSGDGVNDRVKNGNTPLHIAAYKGHAAVARLLIKHGARVNARTKDGITPLDWAQRNGHEDVAILLVSHGAKTTESTLGWSSDNNLTDRNKGNKENPVRTVLPIQRKPLNHTLLLSPERNNSAVYRPFEADRRTEKTVPGASYRIQMGTFSSKQRAMDARNSYKKRHLEILGSRELVLNQVTVKENNYYRVQTRPMSKLDAKAICDRLEEANQDCLVMKRKP